MDEKQKKLNLMKYWLFGSYAIIAAAISTFLFILFVGLGGSAADILKLPVFWIFLVGLALLFVIVYLIYKAIVDKKE
ncbi:MAG: hypothetical protein PVF83_06945 [Anaerolineales bacterium]